MKSILCFGDSNTWGYEPVTGERYDFVTRWTGAIQKRLGSEFRIIEEGLNGRTTNRNEQERPFRSGAELLPVLLECHRPVDLLIIMLGTNDLKTQFDDTPQAIASNVKQLCQIAIESEFFNASSSKILLVSPTHVTKMPAEDAAIFEGALEKSKRLASEYKQVAKELGILFFDACEAVTITNADGVHWTAKQHFDFALAIEKCVRNISF